MSLTLAFNGFFKGASSGGVYDFENALQFDGVNDYVNFTEQTYASTVFSASFWINYTTGNNNRIIFGSDSNSNRYFRLDNATQFSMRTRSAGGSIDTFTVPTISIGQWYHVALSLDNGTNLLWLDGNQYSSNNSVNYANETIAVGRIGGRSDTTQMTHAVIDDFIIQSTVLDQTEVDFIYNSGAGNPPTTAFPSSDVYYKFNESSGTSAADSSGNGNTGTLNNFTGIYFIPHASYNFGNYIQPDGVNDDGELNSQIVLGTSTDWVVSFWAKGSGSSNTSNVIFSDRTSTGYYSYLRKGSSPYVRWSFGANNTRHDWSQAALSGWDDGDWHHVYFYNVGVDVHLVFDGVDYGDGAATANQNGVRIRDLFYRQVSSSIHSNVAMDDFIAHEITGSVTQAQSLYNSGAGENPVTVFGSTPQYWYKFNVTDGTTTIPNSGSAGSNDLTLSNFVTPYIFPH